MNRILVVDDDPLIVEELHEFFTDAGISCTGCVNPNEAIRIFQETEEINIVVSDYRMPELTGIELVRILAKTKKKNRIMGSILFAAESERGDVVAAMRAGVFDYLTKPLDLELLLGSVKRLKKKLQDKHRYLSAKLVVERIMNMASMLDEVQRDVGTLRYSEELGRALKPDPKEISRMKLSIEKDLNLSALSRRQTEVARLIAQGMTNYQIACELSISENTVKFYVSQVLKITGMPSRTKLAIVLSNLDTFE